MDLEELIVTVENIQGDSEINLTGASKYQIAQEVVSSLDEDDLDEVISSIHITELIRLMTDSDTTLPSCCYQHFCRAAILIFLVINLYPNSDYVAINNANLD